MNFYVTKYIAILLAVVFAACGRFVSPFDHTSESAVSDADLVDVPIVMRPASGGLALEGEDSDGLGLVSASAFNVSLTSCSSGYTATVTQANTVLTAYINDKNCLIKLNSFTASGVAYTPSTTHPFTTWQAGDYTYFQDASSNLIYVTIVSTLSSPLLASNVIVIQFGGGPTAGATSNILTQSESSLAGNHVDSAGFSSPTFQLKVASLNTVSGTNTASLTLTLACTTLMSASKCNNITMPAGDATYTVTYGFAPAISLTQTYTTAQLNNVTLSTTGSVLAPGASSGGVTITNGGMVTNTGAVTVSLNGAGFVTFIQKIVQISGGAYTYNYWNIFIGDQSPAGSVSACSTTFSGGAGTSTNPYLISNATQLGSVNTGACASNSVYFLQINDIDLGGSTLTTWTPVSLTGQYNGGGYTISGLYINSSTTTANIGLFSTINAGAAVSNLTLTSVSISSNGTVGALAGTSSGTITNCQASGTLTVSMSSHAAIAGGLVGYMTGGSINWSNANVAINTNVTGSGGFNASIGGLVGQMDSSVSSPASISNSSARGNLTGSGTGAGSGYYNGGSLVGALPFGTSTMTITNSFATGNQSVTISGTPSYVMLGFIGQQYGGTITGCFVAGSFSFTGTVTNANIGGFAGYTNDVTYSNSYSMVTISNTGTGKNATGGFIAQAGLSTSASTSYSSSPSITGGGTGVTAVFIGQGTVTLTNAYYNNSIGTQTMTGLTGLTPAQMIVSTNFTGFTFGTASSNNWQMPTANPLAALLSPVQVWQCGRNGIVCSNPCATSSFASGAGTSGNPYIVSNAMQLAATSSCTASTVYFQQSQNINLGGSTFPQWIPITLGAQYNGNNYTISNLYVNSTTLVTTGLFSTISSGATVSNLNVSNVNLAFSGSVPGANNTGNVAPIAGTLDNGTVTNCTASGSITISNAGGSGGAAHGGGLIGFMSAGTVSSSSSSVNITHTPTATVGQIHVGGFVGEISSSSAATLTNNYATGNITANSGSSSSESFRSGGFVGQIHANGAVPTISNSYSTGNHTIASTFPSTSNLAVGGFAGFVMNSGFTGNYSAGTITISGNGGNLYLGGFAAWVAIIAGTTITDSYTMTTIDATAASMSGTTQVAGGYIGAVDVTTTITRGYSAVPSITPQTTGTIFTAVNGFIGSNTGGSCSGTCYFYDNTSVPSQSPSITNVTGLTTELQMETQGNYTGWTFGTSSTTNWQIPVSNSLASPTTLLSPVLQWQCTANNTVKTANCL